MKSTHLTEEPFQLFALGLDAGGTSTRWALANRSGQVVAEGKAAALSGWMLTSADGQKQMSAALQDIAKQCQTLTHGEPAMAMGPMAALCFGLTGFDGDAAPQLAPLLTQAFGVPAARQRLFNDVELACRAVFAPGEGYLVYAGTGSVAAFVDEHEVQHRAGGRGGLIDDGGSGYWIAREALRHIWRAEDEAPGSWMQSAMAQRVFAKVGGSAGRPRAAGFMALRVGNSASLPWPWPAPQMKTLRPWTSCSAPGWNWRAWGWPWCDVVVLGRWPWPGACLIFTPPCSWLRSKVWRGTSYCRAKFSRRTTLRQDWLHKSMPKWMRKWSQAWPSTPPVGHDAARVAHGPCRRCSAGCVARWLCHG